MLIDLHRILQQVPVFVSLAGIIPQMDASSSATKGAKYAVEAGLATAYGARNSIT